MRMDSTGMLMRVRRTRRGVEGHSSWVRVAVQGSVNVALAAIVVVVVVEERPKKRTGTGGLTRTVGTSGEHEIYNLLRRGSNDSHFPKKAFASPDLDPGLSSPLLRSARLVQTSRYPYFQLVSPYATAGDVNTAQQMTYVELWAPREPIQPSLPPSLPVSQSCYRLHTQSWQYVAWMHTYAHCRWPGAKLERDLATCRITGMVDNSRGLMALVVSATTAGD